MSKKPLALPRKPSPAFTQVDPKTRDEFVRGEENKSSEAPKLQISRASELQVSQNVSDSTDKQLLIKKPKVHKEINQASSKRSRAIVERKDGRQLTQTTLYMHPDLAKKLTLYCTINEKNQSEFICNLLQEHLKNWKPF